MGAYNWAWLYHAYDTFKRENNRIVVVVVKGTIEMWWGCWRENNRNAVVVEKQQKCGGGCV